MHVQLHLKKTCVFMIRSLKVVAGLMPLWGIACLTCMQNVRACVLMSGSLKVDWIQMFLHRP